MAEEANKGNPKKLKTEIENLKYSMKKSQLYKAIQRSSRPR